MSNTKRFYNGTAFGKSADKQHLKLTCMDCEGEDVLLPLDIALEPFLEEQQKFSEAHRPCRNGQDEPDYSQGETDE